MKVPTLEELHRVADLGARVPRVVRRMRRLDQMGVPIARARELAWAEETETCLEKNCQAVHI